MNSEFITYGDAKVMVSNVTLAQAEELAEMLRGVDGVKDVVFEKDTHHYNSASALFEVTFDGEKLDEISIQGVKNVRAALDGYDTYITTEVGNLTGEILEREMRIVLIILMCSIFVVLLLTSHTYAEVPVLIITFGVAVWVNKGTNYWFHEVSFITNSIAAVLQLGLGIDYAIIMCHHYTEEREHLEPREATIRALTLAIPEISASSLTTISGLLALSFMKIKIGEDMSLVLIKSILFLMLTVFFLMPALIMYMSPWIDRTHHRQFLPRIDALGRFAIRSRYIVPPIFLVIIIAGFLLSGAKCPYEDRASELRATARSPRDTIKQNDYKIAEKQINATFGETNQVVPFIFPFTDFESEAGLSDRRRRAHGCRSHRRRTNAGVVKSEVIGHHR
ncbi:MAG: MMPL family transporter [Oscillospiraceae bacterium]